MSESLVPTEARHALPPTAAAVAPLVPVLAPVRAVAILVQATVRVMFLSPGLLAVSAAHLVPGDSLSRPRASAVVVGPAPLLLPLLAPASTGRVRLPALGVIAARPRVRPLDASALAVPLLAPLLRPAVRVAVLGRGAVLERARLLAVSIDGTVRAVILGPTLRPALSRGGVAPLARLAVDERRAVDIVLVNLLPALLPRLSVGVSPRFHRAELAVGVGIRRLPKLLLPLHRPVRGGAADNGP